MAGAGRSGQTAPDPEYAALCLRHSKSTCVTNIITNNGLREIAAGAGLPIEVLAHMWQALDCPDRQTGVTAATKNKRTGTAKVGSCPPCDRRNKAMVLAFASLERAKYPIVESLPAPLFNGASIVPGVIDEELATPWRLGDERRGQGYAWNYWCQGAQPLLFGTPDEGFAVDGAKQVILKDHRHIIKRTQETYRMPAAEEKKQQDKARLAGLAGTTIVVPDGYTRMPDGSYKATVHLEEGITGSFFGRAAAPSNHGPEQGGNWSKRMCASGTTTTTMIFYVGFTAEGSAGIVKGPPRTPGQVFS